VTPEVTPEVTPGRTTCPDCSPGGHGTSASPDGSVLAETDSPGIPTGPSTDISNGPGAPGGVNMGIVLLALGALAIVTLLVTPAPAKIRERGRRK